MTSAQWRYKGEPIELSNAEGVKTRLRQLGDPWETLVEANGHILPDGVLYGRIKRTKGVWDAPEYTECELRLRSNGEVKTLAFGNCLGRVTSNQGLVGYANITANKLRVVGQCIFQPNQTALSGTVTGGDFSWVLRPGATLREKASGYVSVKKPSGQIALDLAFPSKWEEDDGRVVKVAVTRDGQLLGHAMRSFNPVFAKGYRVGLWMRDEIPIFQAAVAIDLSDVLWNSLLLAIFGVWFCYAPIKGEKSTG